jgi:hypothetical protein
MSPAGAFRDGRLPTIGVAARRSRPANHRGLDPLCRRSKITADMATGQDETSHDALADLVADARRQLAHEKLLPTLAHAEEDSLSSALRVAVSNTRDLLQLSAARTVTTGLSLAPLVLAIILFLFVNPDLWELLGSLPFARFSAFFALFAVGTLAIALLMLLPELSNTLRSSTRAPRADVEARATKTAVGRKLIDATSPLPDSRRRKEFRLTTPQQVNLFLILVTPLLFIIAVVDTLWFIAFVVLGFVAIDRELTEEWTTVESVSLLVSSGDLVVTEPLIRVAATLAVLAGLTFAAEVLRDRELRKRLVENDCSDMAKWIAVWVYCKHAEMDIGRSSTPKRG